MHSGIELIEAQAEAHRIASLAVEKYDLTLQRMQQRKETRQDIRDDLVYERTFDLLEREVDARQRLAMATFAGSAALDEANIQSKLATELSRARVEAGTTEAAAIETLVRQESRWTRVASAANLVQKTIEAGRTPWEQYTRQIDDATRAMTLLQSQGVELSATDLAAFGRGLQELNPRFQELQQTATDADEFPAETANDPECIALFMEAVR